MKKRQTSERLIRRIFNRIFLLLTLLNIAAVVTYNVIQISQTEAAAIMKGMTSQKADSLNQMRFESLDGFGERTDFIRIQSKDGSVIKSAGTDQFLKSRSIHLGKFILSDEGIFDYARLDKSGTTFELWLSINAIVENALVMVLAIIGVMLVTYIIGLVFIRRSSKKLSEPIEKLTHDVKSGEGLLEIPENPSEVHDLALDFNGLIGRLNQKIEQEKQFVSDASHELRTPIAAIRGHVVLLKRRWQEHPEIVEESLDYLDRESHRLKTLIEELLTLSRQEQKEATIEEIDLSALIEEVVKMMRATLPQKIEVTVASSSFVSSDRSSLQAILTALVENAGKYAPATSRILIKGDNHGIQVVDEGPGIPDSEKTKIFDRFYRLDKSRGESLGTGLGLAIAAQYAKKNNLKLFVTDNQPQGAIFHLEFPVN